MTSSSNVECNSKTIDDVRIRSFFTIGYSWFTLHCPDSLPLINTREYLLLWWIYSWSKWERGWLWHPHFCRVRNESSSWRVFSVRYKKFTSWSTVVSSEIRKLDSSDNDCLQGTRSAHDSLSWNDGKTVENEWLEEWSALFPSSVLKTWRRYPSHVTWPTVWTSFILRWQQFWLIHKSHQTRQIEKYRQIPRVKNNCDLIVFGIRKKTSSQVKNTMS